VPAAFGWAGLVGFLHSTKFLVQPFVWRNWPLDQVLDGWLHILLDRLVVALAVASCIVIAGRMTARAPRRRLPVLGLAILAGAGAGEALRIAIDPFGDNPDPAAIACRILQWSLISAAAVGILACWRLQADYATAAGDAAAAEARAHRSLLAYELEALQRQIEPHFLFNTLATVRRLGRTAPGRELPLLDRLFDYASQIFTVAQHPESSLGAELDLALAYLDVCAMRMGQRLRIVTEIDPEARASRFPCLMLGTLVENAVKHGLAPAPEGGVITLKARLVDGCVEVQVQDDGVGLSSDGGGGTGLSNLKSRLQLLYGQAASLDLTPLSRGVRATLKAPYAPAC
jgi:signal transduction histidine kinase